MQLNLDVIFDIFDILYQYFLLKMLIHQYLDVVNVNYKIDVHCLNINFKNRIEKLKVI